MISLLTLLILAANDVPVPSACAPSVNAHLAQLVAAGQKHQIDNVMVCGVATENSHTQPGGTHGNHEIIPIRVVFPDKSSKLVEVVTNDALDGKVNARARDGVFAYGQAFFDRTGQYVAGLHDVHCSTHAAADNGWVVVNGAKFPAGVCAVRTKRGRHRNRR